ncbi:SDR family NAD(P)-dependent oxidoreductase [Kribbella sp. NPDC056861]|uniref:SDR family NAD(P)-dependent oxidoreductase n=1 Tax=Kribbella sp. NPDC056861 TaxID=3154857 RepID=UPI003424967D
MADNDAILISGATGCIGSTLARSLYSDGRALVLFGRNAESLEKLAGELPGSQVLVGDIGDADSLAGSLEFPDRLGGVVHAAGICQGRPFGESDPALIREHLEVNLVGPSELTRLALPALREARGTVVLVNSLVGLYPWPGWIGYAMSKYGLRAFAETLRLEEFTTGVRVSSIYASRVATPLQAKVHAQEGKEYVPDEWVQPETMAHTIRSILDTPRDAELKDITLMHQHYPRP